MPELLEFEPSAQNSLRLLAPIEASPASTRPDRHVAFASEMLELYRAGKMFEFVEALAQRILSLKGTAATRELCTTINELETIHTSINLWLLASHPSSPSLLALYFSVPDRVARFFELDGSSCFVPRHFFGKVVSDWERGIAPQVGATVLKRLDRVGFLAEALERIVAASLDYAIQLVCCFDVDLQKKCTAKVVELVHSQVSCRRVESVLLRILDSVSSSSRSALALDLVVSGRMPRVQAVIRTLWSNNLVERRQVLKHVMLQWCDQKSCNMEYTTMTLLTIMGFCASSELFHDVELCVFLGAVQWRLDSTSSSMRTHGMLVAEAYAALCCTQKLDFELDASDPQVILGKSCLAYGALTEQHDAACAPTKPTGHREQQDLEHPIDDYAHIKLHPSHPPRHLDGDLQPMHGALQEHEPPNAKLKTPAFLRDAVDYIGHSDDPERLERGLAVVSRLWTGASSMQREETGERLIRSLLLAGNGFHIDRFDEKRMAVMVQCVQAIPKTAAKLLVSQFMGRSLSLQQKLDVLGIGMLAIQQPCPESPVPAGAPLLHLERQLKLCDPYEKQQVSIRSERMHAELLKSLFFALVRSDEGCTRTCLSVRPLVPAGAHRSVLRLLHLPISYAALSGNL